MKNPKKWSVTVYYTEVTSYLIEVESDNEDEAMSISETYTKRQLEEEYQGKSVWNAEITAEYCEELEEINA